MPAKAITTVFADRAIGERIREYRHKLPRRCSTQQQVASELGWRQTKVANLELGKLSLRACEVLPLADVLGVDPLALLRDEF